MRLAIIPTNQLESTKVEDVEATLEYLQEKVGGFIESVSLPGVTMYINEDGKVQGLDLNRRATDLAHANHAIFPHDVINGPAVLLGAPGDDGENTELPTPVIMALGYMDRATAAPHN